MVDRLTQQGPTVRADAGDLAVPGALAALSGGVAGFVAAADLATDVGVVGNHEFEWGTEHLLVHARKAGFPLMCANAPEVGLPPTALLETACQVLRQKTSLPKTPVDPGQGVKSSRGELG